MDLGEFLESVHCWGIWRGKRSGKMIVIKRIPGRGSQTPIAEKVFPRPEEQFEHFDDTRCGMEKNYKV